MTVTALTALQGGCRDTPRVAWLLPTAWYYWQPALSEFTRRFPQTTVYTGLWSGFAKGFENSLNVEVVGKRKVIPVKQSSTGYGASFTYLSFSIVNLLLKFKPHLIFSSSFGIWTLLALLLKPLGKWRVVIAYEGSSPSVDYRNSPVRLFLRRAMVQTADVCITNSQAGKEYLTQVLRANENSVFVQPYEIPAAKSLFADDQAIPVKQLQVQRPVFLFAGSVMPRKGLHLLLQACHILKMQGYCNYTLQVVGDGWQRNELEAFCKSHNLTDCVQWLGQIDYADIGTYFNQADIFVLPTLEDTWGVVVLEAMLFGKPVLCSKWAGASELVVDGDNGYRFDPYEPEKLAEAMCRFINQPELVSSMSNTSKQLISQHTPEAAAQFLSKVTHFVLGRVNQVEV